MSLRLPVGGTELFVDFGRQNVTSEVLSALLQLAEESDLDLRRTMLAAGSVVNTSEVRAALHMSERAQAPDAKPESLHIRAQVSEFAEAVRNGSIHGVGGAFSHVVNVGIGGSDLGPRLVYGALASVTAPALEVRFVSNVDEHAMTQALESLDPRRTLFVFSSKSFGTAETLHNARRAQLWLGRAMEISDVARHCVVVTAAPDQVDEEDIVAKFIFHTPTEVGGRFSVSSAVNVANEIAFGPEHVSSFRSGMAEMDEHFLQTPFERNAPVLLGLINVWNRTFLMRSSRAIITYADALAGFVPFAQQLEMESNGKHVLRDGMPLSFPTAPVVWGGVGTDAQHAFMQMLHQGTDIVPVDFIGVSRAGTKRNDELIANLVAQAEALAVGWSVEQVMRDGSSFVEAPHQVMPGNRPSTVVLLRHLDAGSLGALIAMYEHITFVQGAVWGINSFDQWGVELGKRIALEVASQLQGAGVDTPSTRTAETLLAWHLEE